VAAEIPDGAFLIARALFNSSLWTMPKEDRLLALTCIGIANWKPRKIWFEGKDITIQRGQFIRSLRQLVEESRLTLQEVRTSLNHLISTHFLTRVRAGQSYLYTVVKYNVYQDFSKYSDLEWAPELRPHQQGSQQGANRVLTGHQQGANNKQESKESKESKEGEEVRASPPVTFKAILGDVLKIAEQNGLTSSAVEGHLFQIAKYQAKCASKDDTIRTKVRGMVVRTDVGPQRLEEYLFSPDALGRDVNAWEDNFRTNGRGANQESGVDKYVRLKKLGVLGDSDPGRRRESR